MIGDRDSVVVDEGNVDGFEVILLKETKSDRRGLMCVLEVNVVDDHRCVSHSQRIGITVSAVVVSGRSVGIDVTRVNDEIVVIWPIVGTVVEVSKKHHCLTCIANFAVDPLQQLNGLVVVGSILKCEDGKISREEMSAEDMSDSD